MLDKFQYIVESDPTFASRLQRLIDNKIARVGGKLVVSGSHVSFYEREFLAYRNPLYGRRTSTLKLNPLTLLEARGFFPRMKPDDLVHTYSITGGTPAYLELAWDAKSFEEALRRLLHPGSILLDEGEALLRQEVREARVYQSILHLLSRGHSSPTGIASASGVDPRVPYNYTRVLEDMGIVERILPLGTAEGGASLH